MARAHAHAGGRGRGWLLAGWAVGVVGVLALNVARPLPGRADEWPWVVGLMAFPVAAALVLARRPGNPIGRLFGLVGMSAAVIFVASWYVQTVPDGPLAGEVEALEAVPAVLEFGGIVALLHLFPTGRPIDARHAIVVTALRWYIATFALVGVVVPGPMAITGRVEPVGDRRPRGARPGESRPASAPSVRPDRVWTTRSGAS